MENTTWYDPCYDSSDDVLRFEFKDDNQWWELIQEMILRSVKRSEGRYLTSITGVAAIIDILAELIGSEKLLISMLSEPEKVIAAMVQSLVDYIVSSTIP